MQTAVSTQPEPAATSTSHPTPSASANQRAKHAANRNTNAVDIRRARHAVSSKANAHAPVQTPPRQQPEPAPQQPPASPTDPGGAGGSRHRRQLLLVARGPRWGPTSRQGNGKSPSTSPPRSIPRTPMTTCGNYCSSSSTASTTVTSTMSTQLTQITLVADQAEGRQAPRPSKSSRDHDQHPTRLTEYDQTKSQLRSYHLPTMRSHTTSPARVPGLRCTPSHNRSRYSSAETPEGRSRR